MAEKVFSCLAVQSYAECRFGKCHYSECRGVPDNSSERVLSAINTRSLLVFIIYINAHTQI